MISGFVLAGGKSRRMGTDKCLLDIAGKTLLENSIDILSQVVDNVYVNSNNAVYSMFGYDLIEDVYKGKGPLAGIHTCLNYSSTEKNIFIPCDMPNVSKELLQFLLDNSSGFDAVVPVCNGFAEPLVCVIDRNAVIVAEKQILDGKFKVLDFFRKIRTNFLDVGNFCKQSKDLFKNLNTPEDIL